MDEPAGTNGDDGAKTAAGRASQAGWERVLGDIRSALETLAAHPLLKDDAIAQQIFADMVHAADMSEFNADVDRLAARLRAIMAKRGLRAPRVRAEVLGSDLRALASEALGDKSRPRSGRTMLRL